MDKVKVVECLHALSTITAFLDEQCGERPKLDHWVDKDGDGFDVDILEFCIGLNNFVEYTNEKLLKMFKDENK